MSKTIRSGSTRQDVSEAELERRWREAFGTTRPASAEERMAEATEAIDEALQRVEQKLAKLREAL